jgi:hypothetical protein
MSKADYHHRQAAVLIRLAQTTSDRSTAKQLMELAAEHTALADAASQSPDHDIATGTAATG